tara:strand:+ start:26946 stop:27284 length:339 start_codon:yes stop_codon:yes gene_type:complete
MDAEDWQRNQDEEAWLNAILEQAEIDEGQRIEEEKATVHATLKEAAAAGMNVPMWRAGREMLLEMIDSTENGDAIREDFESDQLVQGILLEAYASVRLAFSKIDGVLKEVDP